MIGQHCQPLLPPPLRHLHQVITAYELREELLAAEPLDDVDGRYLPQPAAQDFLYRNASTLGHRLGPVGVTREALNRVSFRMEGEDLANDVPLLDAGDAVEAPLVENHPSVGQPDAVKPSVVGGRPCRLPATAGRCEDPIVVNTEERHHFALRGSGRAREIESK